MPLDALIIEVTESALLDDASVALDNLHRMRDAGVRVAIDDFGTGYSSLGYLSRLPVDILKIDRAFVAELDDGRRAWRAGGGAAARRDARTS